MKRMDPFVVIWRARKIPAYAVIRKAAQEVLPESL